MRAEIEEVPLQHWLATAESLALVGGYANARAAWAAIDRGEHGDTFWRGRMVNMRDILRACGVSV